MKKQPERTERTRQALIESFWQLYAVRKIEKITVKDIVAGAGFYRSTFYEYFKDVYDVLETVEQRMLDEFTQASTRTLAAQRMDEALENMLAFYQKNGERITLLLGSNGDPKFYEKAEATIKEHLLARLHLPVEDPKVDLSFQLFASSMITMLNYWQAHQDTMSLREVFETGLEMMIPGRLLREAFPAVGPPRGKELTET